jgi:DNA-binding CsgD family transcriptional regulator
MVIVMGRSDQSTGAAVHFAQNIFDATATAFYEIDEKHDLRRFYLSGIPEPFHRRYLEGMGRLDPQHPRHAADLDVARLSEAHGAGQARETALFRSFARQCGIVDMINFFFRHDDEIVAGMTVAWGPGVKIPEDAMATAQKIHRYLEFNLVGRPLLRDNGRQYGLTSRETDVVQLLCRGQTNREISERLEISQATVKTHLIHIFEKLGVDTRSAVVALMARLQ